MSQRPIFHSYDVVITVDSDEQAVSLCQDLDALIGTKRPRHCPLPFRNVYAVVISPCGTIGLLFQELNAPLAATPQYFYHISGWQQLPQREITQHVRRWQTYSQHQEHAVLLAHRLEAMAGAPLTDLPKDTLAQLSQLLDQCENHVALTHKN